MIHASFDRSSRSAAISGVYQYDTGQRLRMHGLPSPEEFAGRDDLLSGDLVTVQVHFSRMDDSQSEMRLAIYDPETHTYTAGVPDEYLVSSEEIRVHVYAYYGEDGEEFRAETDYEGVFTPVRRAAPVNIATPEQEDEWETKQGEIEIALTAVQAAQENASGAAAQLNPIEEFAREARDAARAAAESASAAAKAVNDAGEALATADFSIATLPADSPATVSMENDGDRKRVAFGIPQGRQGAKGPKGDKGPADVTLVMDGSTLYITTN